MDETVFFQAGGLVLVLWSRQKLALDAGTADDDSDAFGGMTLAHNVRSKGEVDQIIAAAQQAGTTITRSPATTF